MTFAFMLLTLATHAQFKIHSDGYTSFKTNSFASWSWATLSHANDSVQKHWIVSFPRRTPNHTFFVTGEGNVYKNGTLSLADPGLKSIAITSTIEPISIGDSDKVTFRATDSFQITGPFQVDSGGEMTVIMQSCPE